MQDDADVRLRTRLSERPNLALLGFLLLPLGRARLTHLAASIRSRPAEER